MQRLGDAARLEARRRAWERFSQWERRATEDRAVGKVIADLGTVRDLLPDAVRRHDPDPTKQGIACLHRALAGLGRPR